MRITFLLPTFAPRPSGGFRVVYEYANRLVERGHEVTVVHPRRLPYEQRWPYRGVVPWLRARAGRVRRALFTPRLTWFPIDPRVRLLFTPDTAEHRIPDADAIFATWWVTAELVAGYGPEKGSRCYLLQSHEVWGGPAERVEATWRAPLEKVVIARWLYEKGLELGVPARAMTHIPIGIDSSHFTLTRPLEERPPRVAMLGSTAAVKGLGEGLRALELARAEVPALEAVLFGIEPRPPELPQWVEYVENPAPRVLVGEIYNGSCIYLCSSRLEGWHLPPAEAMACGCAVVSTDIGGVRDYAVHGETALLSAPEDPEALADNLIRLLLDDEERIRLARAGHERIQRFNWSESTDRLEAFLTGVAGSDVSSPRSPAAR
jgi:glycosyltransferase involved in cell wall biosynthesis